MKDRLELRDMPGGPAHFLDDLLLAQGTAIEIQLADGSWLLGEYTWSGDASRWAAMRIELAARASESHAGDRPPAAVIAIPPSAIVRRGVS